MIELPELLLIVMLMVVGGGLALWLLWRMQVAAEPQYYVRALGPPAEPKCPQCGYGLYYAEDHRCPECGRSFEIKELDMRLAQWDGRVLQPKKLQDE